MKDLYLIIKQCDGGEQPYYATFNANSAIIIWNDCVEECNHIYYDFELRKYNVGDFKIIKKRNKNT